ncbi:hypothetical protein SteCoe_457 [Stentor coeruleus]|uniref:Uncharacterized protein n=1 Tax=Stentor coeruleus TaxID=5963 RepID=A0A1R2D4A6_9CILI|nr:hypothetical protein SteCoe_457 [Stentor coeruleus]
MFRLCRICGTKANWSCVCSSVFICDAHLATHLAETGKHDIRKASVENKRHFQEEILKRISQIELCTESIQNSAKNIVASIIKMQASAVIRLQAKKKEYIELLKNTQTDESAEEALKTIKTGFFCEALEEVPNVETLKSFFMQNFVEEYDLPEEKIELGNIDYGKDLLENKYNLCIEDYIGPVDHIAKDNQDKFLVVASKDFSLHLLDLNEKKQLKVFRGHTGHITSLVFNSPLNLIVSSSTDETIRIWDKTYKNPHIVIKSEFGTVHSLGISTSRKLIYAGCENSSIAIWNIQAQNSEGVLQGHSSKVIIIIISSDDETLISGGSDNKIIVWNLQDLQIKTQFQLNSHLQSLVLLPDNTTIISSTQDKIISFFSINENTKTGQVQNLFESANSLSCSHNGEFVLLSTNRKINLLTVKLKKIENFTQNSPNKINTLLISADDKTFILGSNDIKIYDIEEKKIKSSLNFGHSDKVTSLAISSDGKKIISGSIDKTIKIWNLDTQELEGVLNAHTDTISDLHITKNNSNLISASYDKTIKIWNLIEKKLEGNFTGHYGKVMKIYITKSEDHIISISEDKTLKVWNLSQMKCISNIQGMNNDVGILVLSNDENYAVTGSDDKIIRIVNIREKKIDKVLEGHNAGITALELSSDNNFLASGSLDKSIRLWDFNKRIAVGVFNGHEGKVDRICFTGDCRFLASKSCDGRVKIWDVRNQKQVYEGKNDRKPENWVKRFMEIRFLFRF